MFDIGFSELLVIAVVALVVIGPERLPTVARTVGALLGRLNRYVSDVKSDVEREMRLEEMKKLRAEVEAQAAGIEQQVVGELEATRAVATQPVAEINQSLADVMHETGNASDTTQPATQIAAATGVRSGVPAAESGAEAAPVAEDVPRAADAGVSKA
jgi:sec-independent protein translocase protein TatB